MDKGKSLIWSKMRPPSREVRRVFAYQYEGSKLADPDLSVGTTGLRTWPAALLLANYLIGNTSIVSSRSVLELGSGAGLVAALVSQMQASSTGSLIATDFHHSVVERLRGNIARSQLYSGTLARDQLMVILLPDVRKLECPSAVHSTATEVKRLDWSQPQSLGPTQPIELIIASDVVS